MEMRNVSLKSSQSGLIEILLMMGIVTIAIMSLLSVVFQKRSLQINTETKLSIDVLQQNYAMYIQDDVAWRLTVRDSNNVTFACLFDGSPCNKQPQPIAILRNSNNEVAVNTANTMGIMPDGSVCSGYATSSSGNFDKTIQTNVACAMHVDLTWQPICKGACKNPSLIQVNIAINRTSATANSSSAARFIASAVALTRKPTGMPAVSQIGVGKYHTCALAEGSVYCWGENGSGELGIGSVGGSFSTPQKVKGLPKGVSTISVGMQTTCVLQGGNVWCWGNYFSPSPTIIFDSTTGSPLKDVADLNHDFGHGCAITNNGAAYCWGGNQDGELGHATPPTPQIFDPFDQVWFGLNGPAFPVYGLSRGINGPDWGKVTNINLENGKSWAVVDDGTNTVVWEWGIMDASYGNTNVVMSGDFFIMGMSAFYNIYSTPPHSTYKICWPYIKKGAALPGVSDPFVYNGLYYPPGGGILSFDVTKCNPQPEKTDYAILQSNVKQIYNSYGTKCVLLNNGDLVCGGTYDYGRQATNPPNGNQTPHLVTTIHGVETLGANAAGFYAIKGGELWAWGDNNTGNALGDPSGISYWPYLGNVWQPFKVNLPPGVTNVMQGGSDEGYHMCAVANSIAYCWGQNKHGQLGDGTYTDQLTGNPVMVTTWP